MRASRGLKWENKMYKLKRSIAIKGKVVSLYGRKKISGKNLSKQEGMIADSSDTIKVVLWESFNDSVEEGKTYEFINFINTVFILEVVEMGVVLRKWKVL